MNESLPPTQDKQTKEGWAPFDYTDGREKGEWMSFYPKTAKLHIRLETGYLVFWSVLYLAAIFYILYELYWNLDFGSLVTVSDKKDTSGKVMFLGFVSAWIGGSLGGCSFGLKWMYHSVAKRLWHEDRRLWRLLTPHLSGTVSLFMVFLISSGLLQIFDNKFVERPIGVLAFSFLVGYFSDKALAKMAEIADTLFGGQKKD